jgi:hypothetical protein
MALNGLLIHFFPISDEKYFRPATNDPFQPTQAHQLTTTNNNHHTTNIGGGEENNQPTNPSNPSIHHSINQSINRS